MTIVDNAPNSPQVVPLSGIGVAAPAVKLSVASLTFANQTVGTASAAKSVTLTNTGTAIMNIAGIVVAGANAGDFARTTTCGATLAVGASCTLAASFAPTAAGTLTASLSLTTDAPGSPHLIAMTGTGVLTPKVSFTPASLAFGSVTIATASAAKTVTLSNTGNGALTISAIALSGSAPGDYSQTNDCGASLAAGASCTISVVFQPLAAGTRNAGLSIANNAAGSPHLVNLTGTGL